MRVLEVVNFGRDDLALLFNQLGYKLGVEIGVADGVYSKTLCDANPDLKLYGVDPYTVHKGYTDYTRKAIFTRMEAGAHELLKDYNYEFIKDYSMNALKRFEDNSLDFVYIDGNHADPYLTQDMRGWWEKIRPGGILSGHDYIRTRNARNDTIQATAFFSRDYNRPLFVLGDNRYRAGDVRDKARSWMFQK